MTNIVLLIFVSGVILLAVVVDAARRLSDG